VDAVKDYGPTLILHLGDSDPNGHSIFQSFVEDVDEFLAQEGHPDFLKVERVALTLEQMEQWSIEGEPCKYDKHGNPTDKCAGAWLAHGITRKAQLESSRRTRSPVR